MFAGASLLLYRPVFDVFFSMDDLLFLRQAAGLAPWPDTLGRLVSSRGFFTAAWHLFGARPELYHLVILVLHGLCAWLVVCLGRRLGLSYRGAVIAGLCHLCSPVAFTSLHWISGGQEVFFAFFALLTALCLLGGGVAQAAAVFLFALTLLSKEAGVLLLPVLCLVLPMARRRRALLAGVGLVLGVGALLAMGSLRAREPGSPYETAYGLNVVEALLKHIAWLVRFWDFHPDRIVTHPPAVWPWGLTLPALLAFFAWRRTAWRSTILRAAVVFLALLAPVLPLLRHSCHYYLLVPLIPLWLLAAAGLERLPSRIRRTGFLVPVVLGLLTVWQGNARRHDMMNETLHADPILRYSHLVADAVENFRAAEGPKNGKVLILPGIMGEESLDLSPQRSLRENEVRVRFVMLERALQDVDNLRLFFPELESVTLAQDIDELPGEEWLEHEIYINTGQVYLTYLGRGVAGSHAFARIMFHAEEFPRARREIERILRVQPGRPQLISELGQIALASGDRALVDSVLTDLDTRADTGPYHERARLEYDKLSAKVRGAAQ